jgi:hypothetical protein
MSTELQSPEVEVELRSKKIEEEKIIKDIEQEIECPRCYDVIVHFEPNRNLLGLQSWSTLVFLSFQHSQYIIKEQR